MDTNRQDAAAIAWLLMVRRYGLEAIRPADTDTGQQHGPRELIAPHFCPSGCPTNCRQRPV